MKEMLPIGSVIETGSNIKYIIVGKNIKYEDKSYDYVCLNYPFGYVQDIDFKYINNNEVVILDFLGDINY